MLLVVGVIAASSGMVMPALTHMVSVQTVLPLGVALGLQSALSSLGQGLGSAAVGVLYGPLGECFFWGSAALMALGAIIATGMPGTVRTWMRRRISTKSMRCGDAHRTDDAADCTSLRISTGRPCCPP